MAVDWYNENANRTYPFVENKSANLSNNEILDCGFYLKNMDAPTIYLSNKDENATTVSYTFSYADCEHPLTFTAPKATEWQTVWSSADDNSWYGFCVIGSTDQIIDAGYPGTQQPL